SDSKTDDDRCHRFGSATAMCCRLPGTKPDPTHNSAKPPKHYLGSICPRLPFERVDLVERLSHRENMQERSPPSWLGRRRPNNAEAPPPSAARFPRGWIPSVETSSLCRIE